MSTDVAYGGFSLKLNEELQSEDSLKKVAKSLGFEWKDNWEWDDIMYSDNSFMNQWKPMLDDNGCYGFVYMTLYEYDCHYIEHYASITDMGKALKEFIDKTHIMPKENIKSFGLVYYNGSESPFKF